MAPFYSLFPVLLQTASVLSHIFLEKQTFCGTGSAICSDAGLTLKKLLLRLVRPQEGLPGGESESMSFSCWRQFQPGADGDLWVRNISTQTL